jgi:branched-chain amino acid transport system ATP-binding protein
MPDQPLTSGGLQTAAAPEAEPLLDVRNLTAGYRKRAVIYDVSLKVNPGEWVVLLGSNGAGKTTTLKSIVGLVDPFAGDVSYDGKPWRTDRPWRAASTGVAFIPSERFTFAALSVEENLALGAYTCKSAAERTRRVEMVKGMFPILAQRGSQKAGTLSGGEQRMLSLADALMSGPRLFLLDEPSLGLQPNLVQQVMDTIGNLVKNHGMSVLMVEQSVGQALRQADRVYVMRSGRIILEETADQLLARGEWWDLF